MRPLDGAHLRPRSMKAASDGDELAGADEDDSPIDGWMRGRRPHSMGGNGDEIGPGAAGANRDSALERKLARGHTDVRDNIGPDDDATIQRKSTNLDDDSVDEPPAQLRARSK